MRSVVFVAVIGALLAACTVAEAGVVWATVPGPALYSTLYKVDPTTGKSLGSIADLPLPADDVSFANDGLSFWVADSARGFPKEC